MSSNIFYPLPPWRTGRGRWMPPWVLLKRDGFWSLFSWLSVETVHECDCGSEVWSSLIGAFLPDSFSVRYQYVDLSHIPHRIGSRSGLPVPIYPLQCTSPQCSQFWVVNHDILDLVENDREFHEIFFWYISSARCGPQSALSVLRFCRAEHRGGLTFLMTLCGMERTSSRHWCKIFDWIRSQPRDVHKCNRSLLDSNKEGILKIALLELFRITRITLHCPFHKSSLSHRHWMGCRRDFAASQLEVLLDEDDSRSSSRVREHGSFLLVSQLHVVNVYSSRCVNKPMDCPLTSLPVLIWSASTFSSASSSLLNVQQTLAHNSSPGLSVLTLVLSQPNETLFRFPE